MSNFFGQFDEPAGTSSPAEKNFFDQFDEPQPADRIAQAEVYNTDLNQRMGIAEPAPEVGAEQSERGFFNNAARGAGERAADLGGGLLNTMAAAVESAPQGGFAPGYVGQFVSREQDAKNKKLAADSLVGGANTLRATDLDYDEKRNTLDGAKAKLGAGQYLSAAAELFAAGNESLLTSAPDMAGAVGVLPVYVAARTGEIANERAKNKGLDRPTQIEINEAAPFALASSLLERILPGRVLRGAGEVSEQVAKEISDGAIRYVMQKAASEAGKSALIEGGTEFVQEGVIEYIGQRYGTGAAMDANEAISQGVEAAILGGIGGGTLGAGKGAYDGVIDTRKQAPLDGDIDLPQNGEEIGGGIVDDLQQENSSPLQLSHNPQRMVVMPDGTTAWESEISDLPDAAGMQHPGYARLSETPDEIEQSLSGDVDIDTELAELMADLDRAESIAREATPIMDEGINPFDQFDGEVKPQGLFDGVREMQSASALAVRQQEAARRELMNANFQEDEEGGLFSGVRTLAEQSQFEPMPTDDANVSGLEDIYPPDVKPSVRPGQSDARVNTQLPVGLNDQRLTRPEYRNQLERMAGELVKGGGVGFVRDEHDRITGRTPSLNPDWFKSMGENPETAMSVADTQAAIQKALAGERLSVRQARAVGAALDAIGEERGSYAREIRAMRENARSDRRKAFEDWLAATNAPVDAEFESEVWPEAPGETFSETDYLPENTMESRAISELANAADSYGVDWKEIDAALESGDIDAQTKALTELIWNARNEHRQTTKQPEQSAASAQSRSSASESTTGALEKEPANEAQSAAEIIDSAAAEAATSPENNLPEPTEAQKEAGNYKKAHVNIQGLDIAIESPRGSTRSGTDNDGNAWSVTMHNHYGYIKRTEGADGDHVDVFIGPNPDSEKVFIVDQVNADGSFDEHKILMAFDSKLKARSGYKSNYSNGWKVGPITSMTMGEFKEWLKSGDTKKPLSDHFAGAGKMVGNQSENARDMVPTPVSVPSKDAEPAPTESAKEINDEMDKLVGIAEQRAQAEFERNGGGRPPVPLSGFEYLTTEERARMHELKLALPSYGEERDAAKSRLAERVAARKRSADPVKDSLTPEILTQSKKQFIAGMAKERGLKKGSPGYADAMRKVEADYEIELDKAQAALPFEEFNRLNSDSPESVNRQAWEALRDEYARFSLGESVKRGMDVSAVQSVASEISKHWKNKYIEFKVVKNIDGLPDIAKKKLEESNKDNPDKQITAKAFYHDGAIYLNAAALRDPADVERAIFHEVHGHYGARVLFGKETSTAMGRLYLAIGGEKGINDIAKKHNIDLSKYEQILKKGTPAERIETMTDELLAHIAQDGKPSIKRWLQEVIGSIRTWLRAHGFPNLGNFSDSEIMALLKRTREAATELKLDGGSVLRVLLDVADEGATLSGENAQAAYSLSSIPPGIRKIIKDDPLLAAWTTLAQDDLAFQLPISNAKTLEDIFAETVPDVKLERAPDFDDEGAQVWKLEPNDSTLALVFVKGDEVWIDVADFKQGQGGRRIYNAVANYAYNTAKTFIGDPAGLSDNAISRRLENMVSSALKFGTTKHIRPHEKQLNGGAGVPGIKWKDGDDTHNLKEMIKASYEATKNQFPEIEKLRYDPESDQFIHQDSGNVYTKRELNDLADSKRPRSNSGSSNSGAESGIRAKTTAGRRTIERAILTHSILRGTREEKSRILARLGRERSERLVGTLYSLASNSTLQTRPSGGFSVSGLQENPIIWGIGIDSILRVWQDKMRPLLRTQNAIKDGDGTIGEKENAYLAEEAFHGKTENDLRKMRERYLEPMAKKMASYNITREELDMYLWAKHAQERNAQIAKINPDMPDGGSGMTNAQAQQILDQAKSEGKKLRLDDLAGIVYQLLDEKRKIMRHSLADDSMVDAWNSTYKFYVPLKGRAVDDSGGSYPRVGRGFDIRGKESLRALGRRTKPESPTLHAIKDTTESIIRYRKNEVGNALLALVEANPNPDYWEAHDTSSPDFERKLLKKQGKEIVGTGKVINKEDYFITKRDGKEYYIRIEDPLLMRAMKNMGPEKMNWVVRQLAKVSRFLSSMVTSYNPEFVITNFSRDIQTAILNLQAEIDLHNGKAKGKQITGAMMKGVPKAARAVYASLRNKKLSGDMADWQKSFDDFRNDGANTGWFQLLDIEQQAAELADLMEMNKASVKGQFLKNRKRIGDFVSNINSAVENAIRLSVYKSAVDAGISRKQAASLAKNLTVNFNRKGEVGASINALYMFFNASVQGTAAFARAMGTLKIDENGKRKLNVAQKAAIGIMVASFGLALLNRGAAGEDDDGENWWDKVPDYVKERNIVLMKSLWGGKEGEYITIPLPYGYNVFNALATSTDSAINSNKGVGESAGAMVKALMGAFSPVGVAESNSFAGTATRTLAPTAIKPLADLAANENFFGSKVYQENFEFGTTKPESHLHLRSTNDFWVWTSEFLNDATGGSPYRSGLIDVSPDKIGYIFNYFVGGAGQFYSRIVHLGIKGAQDREIEAPDVPFVRRFTGKVNWYPDQQKFYERKEEIDQVFSELKSLPITSPERESFKNEHKTLLSLTFISKSVAKDLANLRKQRNKIMDNENFSEKEKEDLLKPIELKMKAAVDRFNAAYIKKHQG